MTQARKTALIRSLLMGHWVVSMLSAVVAFKVDEFYVGTLPLGLLHRRGGLSRHLSLVMPVMTSCRREIGSGCLRRAAECLAAFCEP